jgi:opacity protein-like surface antigen
MKMRVRVGMAAAVWMAFCSIPFSALAQETSKYEFAGAFSYMRIEGNHWTGWDVSGCRNIGGRLGVAVDVAGVSSWQTGNIGGITYQSDRRALTIMAGPKATLFDEGSTAPFVQLLLGAAHESLNIENHQNGVVIHVSNYDESFFAMSLGFGVDHALTGPLAIRGRFDYTGFRKSATSLSPTYWEKGMRLSIGLVLRWGAVNR